MHTTPITTAEPAPVNAAQASASTPQQANAQALAIKAAFELLFGRAPRADELDRFPPALVAEIHHASDLLAQLLQQRHAQKGREHAALETLMQAPMTRAIQAGADFDESRFEAAYQAKLADEAELIIGQRDYLPQHKTRFRELFKAVTTLLADRPRPTLLEFGASEFSAFYKPLIPNLTLHLSDRPTPADYIGFTEQVGFERLGCDAYFALDLEQPPLLSAAHDDPQRPAAQSYDLIVFAEVLEHLVVNPVELMSALLKLLKPDGFLYLTTPNLFRAELREQWLALENPQQIYPAADGNWDRHHHHCEFGAAELLRFLEQAGGKVIAFYYSGCWDAHTDRAADELGNLVFLVTPAPATVGDQTHAAKSTTD
ncbi:class I SAM-dependent methyltransferase [Halochromatium roseum]|uniref:class I SAM-dependent methyltransferase n=1 Tax=Halochromatium roseum TaxID=391920 RepID=UPI00191339F6|nr:class I SAM-dependent methyltransferase [Halochromatium roseum]MBK5938455.1 hypothetical protein [Halochromatium roseum]